ncbi:MAG: hypothetical protein J0H50_08850 [Xanthomonadales bacterium]|nr:hypothetical protein [Xanthomonadales bacterium]
MRWLALGLAVLAPLAMAAAPGERPVAAHGARDGTIPAWTIATLAPAGWTDDCCTYAAAIGVNFVLYQGEWTGKPQRVMVLNVWPRKLPSLAAEVQADRKHYRELDPAGKADDLVLHHRGMACSGTVYAGSDKIDDVVVFCDPGAASGIRLSWSLSFDAGDAGKRALLDAFMRVVVASRYRAGTAPAAPSGA